MWRMHNAQSWNPDHYRAHAAFVPALGNALLELVPSGARDVLDLGCGDGVLTAALAARHPRVLGVDSSEALLQEARLRGLEVRALDGQRLDFEGAFDAVFSNAALHWMKDADAVLGGVYRALRPGGAFVAELGGKRNTATLLEAVLAALARRGIDGAARIPWYFPSPAEYTARLEQAGLRVQALWYFERPTRLPGDVVGWLETFGDALVHAVPADERPALLHEVREAVRPALCDAQGAWTLDYVRLRVVAVRPY